MINEEKSLVFEVNNESANIKYQFILKEKDIKNYAIL